MKEIEDDFEIRCLRGSFCIRCGALMDWHKGTSIYETIWNCKMCGSQFKQFRQGLVPKGWREVFAQTRPQQREAI